MNSRLEALSDRSDPLREPGDAVAAADAAQRDLFEFFAAPPSAAATPPLAAGIAPAEPGATAPPVDEYLAAQEEIEPHERSLEGVVHDEAARAGEIRA